jgi:TolB protein
MGTRMSAASRMLVSACVGTVLVIVALVGGPHVAYSEPRDPLDKGHAPEASAPASLRGPWRGVSMVQKGGRLPEAEVRQLIFVFSDKTITMRVGEKLVAETAYAIDAKAKPAAIDMVLKGQTTLGIYELVGEKLRICLNDLGKGRPKKIPASAGADCDVDLLLYRADRDWPVLHVLDPDGGNARLLVTHPEYTEHGSPEWSLDGSKIAFDACRTILGESWSMSHVFVCSADGQGLKDLGPGAMPSWSPDGKRITFSCYDPRGVWIMNSDGTDRELVDEAGWGAEWCPKGEKIAYTVYGPDGANISVRDLAQGTSRGLLEERYRQIYWGMAWSPDGRWLAFKGTSPGKAELAIVNTEGQGKGFRVLASEGTREVKQIMDNVSWSPDSKQVLTAFATQGNPALQLYVIDLEGKAPPKPLPRQQKGRSYFSVAWSFEGKQILVSTPRESP